MNNAIKARTLPQQIAYRFAYAVSLRHGAERIAERGDPTSVAALPTFLLLGFALENAFASYLIANNHTEPADYKSHDLLRAMNACKKYGLVLSKEATTFVTDQAPMNKSFSFRYPEKLDEVQLPNVKDSCKTVKEIMSDIDVVLKMKGINLEQIAEDL